MADDRLVFLAIETTCDETGAAVLEGPRPPGVGRARDPLERRRLADRPARAVRRRGARDRLAGPCAADPAGDRRGPAAGGRRARRPRRGRRRDPAGAGRRPGRRPDGGQGPGAGARRPAGRRRPPRRAPLRLPARLSRPRVYPVRRAGRLGGPHQPLSTAAARSTPSSSAARSTTRRARRSTRSPACSGLGYPGGPEIERAARGGQSAGVRLPPRRSSTTTGSASASRG